jgi:hypothetical protein
MLGCGFSNRGEAGRDVDHHIHLRGLALSWERKQVSEAADLKTAETFVEALPPEPHLPVGRRLAFGVHLKQHGDAPTL